MQFKVTDKQGKGYELGTTLPSFTLAKVIPRDAKREDPVIWKSFIYSTRTTGPPARTAASWKPLAMASTATPSPSMPPRCATLIRAIRRTTTAIRWDEAATHRLGIYFGGSNGIPVTDYVLDWVPVNTPPLLTRDILEQQSCDSCHMKQPIHHSNRADPSSASPATTSVPGSGRGDLTTLVHKLHGNLDATATKLVSHFPQDPRNCDTCHKGVTPTTPDANNWQHAQEKPCGACHADSTTATGYVSHINGKITSGTLCTQCHAETPATPSPQQRAHGLPRQQAAGRDKLVFKFDDVRYAAPNIESS